MSEVSVKDYSMKCAAFRWISEMVSCGEPRSYSICQIF